MAKKGDARGVIYMACTACQERNYTSQKNRKNDSVRIELKKYCQRCRSHQVHKETK
ncbi:MAG: 50S ribosomal protein L33 [Dehalococcoidia bacterium]|nr:MAG: 50S ribosomal protein L33 [Dehalococcoidia bacterium]